MIHSASPNSVLSLFFRLVDKHSPIIGRDRVAITGRFLLFQEESEMMLVDRVIFTSINDTFVETGKKRKKKEKKRKEKSDNVDGNEFSRPINGITLGVRLIESSMPRDVILSCSWTWFSFSEQRTAWITTIYICTRTIFPIYIHTHTYKIAQSNK